MDAGAAACAADGGNAAVTPNEASTVAPADRNVRRDTCGDSVIGNLHLPDNDVNLPPEIECCQEAADFQNINYEY